MALSKIFGWILIATAGAAATTMLWTLGGLIVADPIRDPMPVVIDAFGSIFVLLLAAVLSGIGYVVCRVLRV